MVRYRHVYGFSGTQVRDHSIDTKKPFAEFTRNAGHFIQAAIQNRQAFDSYAAPQELSKIIARSAA